MSAAAVATPTNANASTKVIRIQDDEKELLFRLREIYGNDYKKYGEYIRREPNVPMTIKKIYKLLDDRKAYRRISDYFHRERAAKKAKDTHSNGVNGSFNLSSTRGITQVPEQISSLHLDHEMEDDDDDELDRNDDDEETGTDHDHHQPPDSPTITNGSDDPLERRQTLQEDEQTQSIRSASLLSSNLQRRKLFPSTNSRCSLGPSVHSASDASTMNGKSDLLSVRAHLEKALHELDRAIIFKDEHVDDEQDRSSKSKNQLLSNGHRHSKLDDIVRSLSHVVTQQQENTRLIINESSVLLLDNDQEHEEKQPVRFLSDSQASLKNILDRLNTLVDRGNSIYDRVESILSELSP